MPILDINIAKRRLQKARNEERKVKKMQIEAEKKYYKEGSITKRYFRELAGKYEDRLEKAKEEQGELERTLNKKIKEIAKRRG